METKYQIWESTTSIALGSFELYLFEAYHKADKENKAKLNAAFPEFFVNPFNS